MSRTVKHPNACHRPRCGLCHPWKRGWTGGDNERTPKRSERRADQPVVDVLATCIPDNTGRPKTERAEGERGGK